MKNKKRFVAKIVFFIFYLLSISQVILLLFHKKELIRHLAKFDISSSLISQLYYQYGNLIGISLTLLTLFWIIYEKARYKRISLEALSLSFLIMLFVIILFIISMESPLSGMVNNAIK